MTLFSESGQRPSPNQPILYSIRIPKRSREISGSKPFLNEGHPHGSFSDENHAANPRKREKSVTFGDCLGSDEVRAELGLSLRDEESEASGICQELVQGEFLGHKQRGVAGKQPAKEIANEPNPRGSKRMPFQPTLQTILSVPSSGRTSIVQSPQVEKPQALTSNSGRGNNHDRRREAEDVHYTSETPTETVRRRNMARTVSKEDYLLARGANPRTGIVTPGVRSASNSYDEVETLKARDLLPPQKWRQKGDQWISLAPDQATPLESPPAQRLRSRDGRLLRAPPKISAAKFNQNAYDSNSAMDPRAPVVRKYIQNPDKVSLPGTFPITPQQDQINPSLEADLRAPPKIRRKPVGDFGNPDSVEALGRQPVRRRQHTPDPSNETVIRRPVAEHQLRSSSAPAPHKAEYFSPNDVGKALPSLPRDGSHGVQQTEYVDIAGRPFLDTPPLSKERAKMDWIEDIPAGAFATGKSKKSGLPRPRGEDNDQNLLQSLPTNSGQSQLRRLEERRLKMLPHSVENIKFPRSRGPSGPRGGNPTYPYVRPMIPPRRYHLNQQSHLGGEGAQTYRLRRSSPHDGNQTNRNRVLGPRMMSPPRELKMGMGMRRETVEGDVFTSPPSVDTTFMSTTTSIPTSTPLEMRQEWTPNHGFQGEHRETDWSMNTNMNLSMRGNRCTREQPLDRHIHHNLDGHGDTRRAMPIPHMAHGRSRPPMPNRADCTDTVPKVNHHHLGVTVRTIGTPTGPRGELFMQNHHQWRMTGTNDTIRNNHQTIEAEQGIGQALRLTANAGVIEGRTVGHQLLDTTDTPRGKEPTSPVETDVKTRSPPQSGLTRQCSRCKSGLSNERPRSTNGVIPMFEKQRRRQGCGEALAEGDAVQGGLTSTEQPPGSWVVDPASSRMTGGGEQDLRDHTICCPECCREQDCHEGCLGHPSPASSPTRSHADSDLSNATTLAEGYGSRSSEETSERSRDILRSTFRDQPSSKKGKNNMKSFGKGKENSPETPRSLGSTLESPGTFWGGDGAGGVKGAVAAAKRAMGFNVNSNEIVVRKRRHNQRSITAPVIPLSALSNTGQPNIPAANANEARRVTSESRLNVPSDSSQAGSKSRNVSGASLLSVEIPAFGSWSIFTVWEMVVVPLEAGVMWWRNHPEVRRWVWRGLERFWEMGRTVAETAARVWWVGRVYGKTGKLKIRGKAKGEGMGGLLWDVGRSTGYLGVFLALAVGLARVLGMVLWAVRIAAAVVRVLGWVVGRVFGVV